MELHPVKIGLSSFVEVSVLLELDHRAGLIRHELERAAADRLGVQVMARLHQHFRHDRRTGEGHVGQEWPCRHGQRELDGQRIDDVDAFDRFDLRFVGICRVLCAEPVEGEFHILGSQRIAVVEFHAIAELEGVSQTVVADLIPGGKIGIRHGIGVDRHQSRIDLLDDDMRHTRRAHRRVEPGGVSREGHLQDAAGHRGILGENCAGKRRQADQCRCGTRACQQTATGHPQTTNRSGSSHCALLLVVPGCIPTLE